jgi:hypothetical protein
MYITKVIVELAANNNISGNNTSDDGNIKYIVAKLNYLAERCSYAEANVSPHPPAPQHRHREERKQGKKE